MLEFGLPVVLVDKPPEIRTYVVTHAYHTCIACVQVPEARVCVLGKVEEEAADRGNETNSLTLSRRGERDLRGRGVTPPVKKKKKHPVSGEEPARKTAHVRPVCRNDG